MQHRKAGGRCVGFQTAADLATAHVGQMAIKDDDVRDFCRKAKPIGTISCVSDFEARCAKGLVESVPSPFIGNDDQRRKW